MRDLLSKLVAGGLSAAVVLLWWPSFVHDEGAVAWLVRGVAWTLSFELLLHALLPLERALWDSAAASRFRGRANRLGAPRHIGSRAALACGALAVPAVLLATAPAPPAGESEAPQVRHVTQVKRIVRVERTPVAPPQPGPVAGAGGEPAPSSSPAAPAPERVATRGPAPRPRATRPAPRRTPPQRGQAPQTPATAPDPQTATESPAPQPRNSAAERPSGVA